MFALCKEADRVCVNTRLKCEQRDYLKLMIDLLHYFGPSVAQLLCALALPGLLCDLTWEGPAPQPADGRWFLSGTDK